MHTEAIITQVSVKWSGCIKSPAGINKKQKPFTHASNILKCAAQSNTDVPINQLAGKQNSFC